MRKKAFCFVIYCPWFVLLIPKKSDCKNSQYLQALLDELSVSEHISQTPLQSTLTSHWSQATEPKNSAGKDSDLMEMPEMYYLCK